ncbi:hypothetical protein [Aquitalea sp. LB_tupeE]|uniref:hypothetical protein n=1 Tax=Aquitalea sp. LB_tupeE TaxID=2748078 RepID=UPI0015C061DE|nr:hypothetical protein [Aquitalea sp. LB_tupeE]NWK78347.1 hypothetical protein [Aquitalea sp. LB_tupeE]
MPLTETICPAIRPERPAFPSHSPDLAENLLLQAKTLLGIFGQQAMQEMKDRSINLPPAICLTNNPDGTIALHSQHPQARAIRLWLNNSHDLRQQFHETRALFELLNACTPSKGYVPGMSFCIGLTSAGPLAYFSH